MIPARLRRGALAILVGTLAVLGTAGPVAAECMLFPPSEEYPFRPGTAFTATVTSVSTVDPSLSDDMTPDWHAEFTVNHSYKGRVPDPLALNGSYNDCGFLDPRALAVGEEIFVVIDQLNADWAGLFGQMLIWQRTADGWAFYVEALQSGSDPRFYPTRAREATTTAEILALVRDGLMPETSTASPPAASSSGGPAIPFVAGILGALAFVWRTRRSAPVVRSRF